MHMFRAMIHTIAKLKREHKIWIHMSMGVSQILHIYITNLIITTFNIIIIKYQNMLKINNMKACRLNKSKR